MKSPTVTKVEAATQKFVNSILDKHLRDLLFDIIKGNIFARISIEGDLRCMGETRFGETEDDTINTAIEELEEKHHRVIKYPRNETGGIIIAIQSIGPDPCVGLDADVFPECDGMGIEPDESDEDDRRSIEGEK